MDLGSLASPFRSVATRSIGAVDDTVFDLRVLIEAGILAPVRPDKLARALWELGRWGASPASGAAVNAITRGEEVGLIDDAGSLSFREVHERSSALARALADDASVGHGDGVAIMCRDHRGFVEATLACSKLGATGLYLNTAFAGPQIVDVIAREKPVALIYDEEFAGLLEGAAESGIPRYVAWAEEGSHSADASLEELIGATDRSDLSPPPEQGRFVILTSGTTGTPKGAQRAQPSGMGPLAALLSKIPLRAGGRTLIGSPMFHSWGFTHLALALPLASTIVLQRRFEPERTLSLAADHRVDAISLVPVMVQRIMELPEETRREYDLSSVNVVALSGSALPGELAIHWMDEFGDNIYNLYGSTEVAWATIATPADLRAAPGTAGKPPRHTVVKIVDENGAELPPGKTGRIFVGNELAFEGYTGGGGKEVIEGLLSSGDVGHFDSDGRLFIDGRDDEMIVSGGENVFPREVEDLLADHEAVAEAAVIGVPDEEFGQRLKAFVVPKDDKELSADDIKAYVKANLARYKVPREVEFLTTLPRNATGKVLKRELA